MMVTFGIYPALLDLLKKHQVHAIIFVVGELAKTHPKLFGVLIIKGIVSVFTIIAMYLVGFKSFEINEGTQCNRKSN